MIGAVDPSSCEVVFAKTGSCIIVCTQTLGDNLTLKISEFVTQQSFNFLPQLVIGRNSTDHQHDRGGRQSITVIREVLHGACLAKLIGICRNRLRRAARSCRRTRSNARQSVRCSMAVRRMSVSTSGGSACPSGMSAVMV